MRFETRPLDSCAGTILAHSRAAGGTRFPKGRLLTERDLATFRAAGVAQLTVAEPGPGDVGEDSAAARLAAALAGDNVVCQDAATGRANLTAQADGVALLERQRIDRINRLDEGLTLATLIPYTRVAAGQILATIKVIPFAVPGRAVEEAEILARERGGLAVAPFRAKRAGLILTRLPHLKESVLEKTREAMAARLAGLGGRLEAVETVDHSQAAVADALERQRAQGLDLYLVAGASAIVDRRDVIPAAVERAGGQVAHFGMPVDPGNLLMLGGLGDAPMLGLPGCARSPKTNGVDWVLQRIMADLPVDSAAIAEMGVGGLLKEIPARPQPRRGSQAPATAFSAAAVVLAAGQSARMGATNKLLQAVDGTPMIRRVVETALASRADPVIVVLGHEAEAVRAALADLPVRFVTAEKYAEGLSQSVRAGLEAVPETAEAAAFLLGDMPHLRAATVNALIDGLAESEAGEAALPVYQGKRGNPVLFRRRHFSEILALTGDTGAKPVLDRLGEEIVEVPVDNPGVLLDVDTRAALGSLAGETASR